MCGLMLKLNVENETGIDKTVVKITEQIPKKGIVLEQGTSVVCDIEEISK